MRRTLVVAAVASLLFVCVGCPPQQPTVPPTTPPPPRAAGGETVGPPLTSDGGTGAVPAATPYPDGGYTAPKAGPATGTDVKPAPAVKNTGKTYTVQAKDTLFGIARAQLGGDAAPKADVAKYVKALKAANPGIDYDKLKPGQVLNMPEK